MSDPDDYTIAWISALGIESVAAQAFLDNEHPRLNFQDKGDNNMYSLGQIEGHNVVIAVHPEGTYGTASAANVARDLTRTFKNIRLGLLVGIGGGAPTEKNDIRLGDVVVSKPSHSSGGVYEYNHEKLHQELSFEQTSSLNNPPPFLLNAVAALGLSHKTNGHQIREAISDAFLRKPRLRKEFSRPDNADYLFRSNVIHVDGSDCVKSCYKSDQDIVPRSPRTDNDDDPAIFYGAIASADQMMKNALLRDQLAAEMGILCFETEAAGFMSNLGFLVVRGICDYADSHKVDSWQGYAAMTAAAYTKELISIIVPSKVESDVQITPKEVTGVVKPVRQHTPPTSQLSFSGTPRTHSSASHIGSEQTKRLLNPVLRRELRECTYESVDGFYDKFFKRKIRDDEEAKRMFTEQYKDGQWLGFPQPSTELEVWEWWSSLQKNYLRKSRGLYYTTKTKNELTGTDADRQLDLFLKHRDALSREKHEWADVQVVGEHKCSRANPNEKYLQLAKYVRDIFKTRPTRRFVHAFLFLGTRIEPFVFDRSGAYSGAPFDIHEEPERFIALFSGYSLMSDEELGLDTFVVRQGNIQSVTLDNLDGSDQQRLEFESQPIFMQSAIVCRGTSCYQTTDRKRVIKFSWRTDKPQTEAEHLLQAQARGVRGIVRPLGVKEVTSISELRNGLSFSRKRIFRDVDSSTETFSQSQTSNAGFRVESVRLQDSKRKSGESGRRPSKKSRSSSQASKLSQESQAHEDSWTVVVTDSSAIKNEKPFRNRILTCLAITPAGRPLQRFQDIPELLCCLRDAIKAHQSLFFKGRILHRDISPNNIIITDPQDADGSYGMLIDLDLSTQIDAAGKNQRSGASKMTGTLKYMAIEVLELAFRDARPDLDHTYRHDLESFFYVFLDICVGKHRQHKPDPLRRWYVGSYEEIADAKVAQMGKTRFETYFLRQFPPTHNCLKSLAISLRDVLFRDGDLYTGTPLDSKELYKDMIQAFDEAIKSISQVTET